MKEGKGGAIIGYSTKWTAALVKKDFAKAKELVAECHDYIATSTFATGIGHEKWKKAIAKDPRTNSSTILIS